MLKVVFISEDVPFTFDNRIRREAATLRAAGAEVSVVAPAAQGESWHEDKDGLHLYRYHSPTLGTGFGAHVYEYGASLSKMAALLAIAYRRHGFDAIHAANPPDLLWTLAVPYKARGVKFVYDHHDLVPELFEERFTGAKRAVLPVVRAAEGMSYRLADHVIATNDTYRRVALDRGRRRPEDVTVVRNGPDPKDFPPGEPDAAVRGMAPHRVGYLGTMNPQDGVDLFLQMARVIRYDLGRDDFGFVAMGSGDSFQDLVRLRDELGLAEVVRMTGRIPWAQVLANLRATDICVQPDPPGGLNDRSTMNKLMEYMALGRATVSFDLPESRVSGGDATVYVPGRDPADLARAVVDLADDPTRRAELGARGLRRIEDVLSWPRQARNLVQVYERLFPGALGPADR